jgi:spore maturation protein CgeB
LRAFFDDGSEVLAYASYDELVEHLKWLLADPLRGRRLGEAASRRSLSQYTYAQRLTTLLEHTA